MVTINIGKGIEMAVDFERLPANAIEHLLKIGARNVLMDAHASITEKEFPDAEARKAAALAVAEKKLLALMSGEVRVAGVRGPRGDEVMRAAMSMVAVPKGDFTAESVAAFKRDYIERNPEVLEKARAFVEAKRAIAPVGDDLLALLKPKA